MSAYDNDRRVRVEPVCQMWRLVTISWGEVAIVKGNDGIYRAFEYEQVRVPASAAWPVGSAGVRLGNQLANVPEGDFNSVVHALIGDPQ